MQAPGCIDDDDVGVTGSRRFHPVEGHSRWIGAALMSHQISADTLGHVTLPVATAIGEVGVVVLLVGMFAAIFSAALETSLSAGYTVSQFFGWQWGTFVKPREAARFHVVVIA